MTEVDSAALVLAGTDAGIYAYGLVAARVTGDERSRALAAMADHRAQRDQLRARITALGGTPAAAAPAYTPPFAVTDARSARRLAALVEDRLAGQWAGLAAAGTGKARAADALTAQSCAVRSVTWSGIAPTWNGVA
jgi:hypothetical protein